VRRALLPLFTLLLAGCVRDAVLENDVRNAEWKSRVLTTQSDWQVAQAALGAQLVELEALYQRAPSDARVSRLLAKGFWLLADGFIEAERLEAIAAGDSAEETRQEQRQADARARRDFYAQRPSAAPDDAQNSAAFLLLSPKRACQAHDRRRYESELNALLVLRESDAEQRLSLALTRRLARDSLAPAVAERCGFAP